MSGPVSFGAPGGGSGAAVLARSHPDLQITGPAVPGGAVQRILTPAACAFLWRLAQEFEPRRQDLLLRRRARQLQLDAGATPGFLPATAGIRRSDWTVAAIPSDLRDRRVEITGPVDRKMIINALNSGANVFMADFEDSNSPTWANCIGGQANLCDAVRRTIDYQAPDGKPYRLNDATATLMVRPRGWHLEEKHVRIGGGSSAGGGGSRAISAALFDFGLYFFHNARELIERGTAPYFYLPKLESHLEARLWNDVFNFAQDELGIPRGTVRATVLIETILAAFETHEILWELRDHSAGLNCGRWDYIFSLIKKLRRYRRFVLSDRAMVRMTTPFMRAYSLLTIQTCHRRGIHAIGGMAAQIPIKNNPTANEAALEAVRQDKRREVGDGHDGTWVAHPGLVPVARAEFEQMSGPEQIARRRDDVQVSAADLLDVPATPVITEQGIRTNLSVGVQYLESWLRGSGCVPINNLMEDAATAEISRAQLWQWVHHNAQTDDGRAITRDGLAQLLEDELRRLRERAGDAAFAAGRYDDAQRLFRRMIDSPEIPEFLTTAAYELL